MNSFCNRQDPSLQVDEQREDDAELQGDGADLLLRERVELREEHGDLHPLHRGRRRSDSCDLQFEEDYLNVDWKY